MENQKLNDEQIQEIRDRLNQFAKENPEVTNRTISDNIRYSISYVSEFRNNKFPTDPSEIALKIQDWLNNELAVVNEAVSKGELKFAMTTAAQDIFKVANYALTEGTI